MVCLLMKTLYKSVNCNLLLPKIPSKVKNQKPSLKILTTPKSQKPNLMTLLSQKNLKLRPMIPPGLKSQKLNHKTLSSPKNPKTPRRWVLRLHQKQK